MGRAAGSGGGCSGRAADAQAARGARCTRRCTRRGRWAKVTCCCRAACASRGFRRTVGQFRRRPCQDTGRPCRSPRRNRPLRRRRHRPPTRLVGNTLGPARSRGCCAAPTAQVAAAGAATGRSSGSSGRCSDGSSGSSGGCSDGCRVAVPGAATGAQAVPGAATGAGGAWSDGCRRCRVWAQRRVQRRVRSRVQCRVRSRALGAWHAQWGRRLHEEAEHRGGAAPHSNQCEARSRQRRRASVPMHWF